jgi:hypothetical protein
MVKKFNIESKSKFNTTVARTMNIGQNFGTCSFNTFVDKEVDVQTDIRVTNNFSNTELDPGYSSCTHLLSKYDAKSARNTAKAVRANVDITTIHAAIESGHMSCVIRGTEKTKMCDLSLYLVTFGFKCKMTEQDGLCVMSIDWSEDLPVSLGQHDKPNDETVQSD